MKFLRQILLITLLGVAFSMTAMAQKDDKQDRPDKDPPKIEPKDKDRPKDRPKDDNKDRPKKPQIVMYLNGAQNEISFV